jgi:hypothetical protein
VRKQKWNVLVHLDCIVHSESLDDDTVFSKSFDIQDVNINYVLYVNKGNAVENAGHHGDLTSDILIAV